VQALVSFVFVWGDGDSAVWCYQRGACHTTATTRAYYCCTTRMTNIVHALHT